MALSKEILRHILDAEVNIRLAIIIAATNESPSTINKLSRIIMDMENCNRIIMDMENCKLMAEYSQMDPSEGRTTQYGREMKTNLVAEYLNEIVNYGGIRMPRHQMIAHLTHMAKATGRLDWRILVDRYLQGHELMQR